MATTVGQYCIYVKDIEAAERFYTDVIGLKVQSRTEIDDVHEVVVAADHGGGRLQLAERYNGGQDIDHGFALGVELARAAGEIQRGQRDFHDNFWGAKRQESARVQPGET